jgi:FAD/FMN-containing dehydrogenase
VQALASHPLHDLGMNHAFVPATTSEAIELLRATLPGRVITAGEPDYDAARGSGHRRPTVIVLAHELDDVVHAVRFARAEHLPIAVRSGGQRSGSDAGGAVLIDLAALDSVTVDPACRTATVAAGATWAAVIEHAGRHGLAPVPGEWSHRSAVSDTLCGGMGWLARRHGLACDSVISFELVTPDGLVVDVSADAQPELFWALSGAGDGSLGVVASIEIDLHPTGPVYAGRLVYDAAVATEALTRWRAWITGARPELTSSVVLTATTVAVHGCWSGAVAVGEQLVDEWRSWLTPIADDWGERSLADTDAVGHPRLAPGSTPMTNEWANALRDELLTELVSIAQATDGPGVVELRLVGGAARSRSESAANGRGRRDQFLITLADLPGSPDAVRERLAPFVTGAVYLDRTDGTERARRTRAAFGAEQWERLCAVKVALDPTNRFRHGLVIEP